MRSLSCLVAACCLAQASAFLLPAATPRAQRYVLHARSEHEQGLCGHTLPFFPFTQKMYSLPTTKVVPLELEGQLDPSKCVIPPPFPFSITHFLVDRPAVVFWWTVCH